MSNQMKNTVPNGKTEEKKIQTRYDRKIQRRKEAAERARKEKVRNIVIFVACTLLVVGGIASFIIMKSKELNAPYFTVNGEVITKTEFDYYKAMEKSNFMNQNSYLFSMLGRDMSTIDTQLYNEQMTFAEYFDQLAAEQIVETMALRDAAKASGFEYNTTKEYKKRISDIKEVAKEQKIAYKEYFQMIYGATASEKRLKDVMKENIYVEAYMKQLEKEKKPSDDAVLAYYEENKGQYDSVDYHATDFPADLPSTTTDEEGNEVEYQPTEEETQAAMEEARKKAEAAEATIAETGEEHLNESNQNSYIQANLYNFLFDETRKAGDTCVVENTSGNGYLAASFEKRYLDETPTADARIIISTSTDSQKILDEWKKGEATEESFIKMLDKYDEAGSSMLEGLYEGVSDNMVNEEIWAWLSAAERKAGDTFAMNVEDDANYVLYYVGKGDPEWKNSIRNTLLAETMNQYLEELTTPYIIEDKEGKLKYLTLEATQE